jgi:putative ATP-dependent endonuclease of OLD family
MDTTKKSAVLDAVSLMPADPVVPRPRLHKLIIKNFRAIGSRPVENELDDIVVLVGSNRFYPAYSDWRTTKEQHRGDWQ